jgi:hypothetical protein
MVVARHLTTSVSRKEASSCVEVGVFMLKEFPVFMVRRVDSGPKERRFSLAAQLSCEWAWGELVADAYE